jgi:SSS family solute:Na+ symporter
MWNRRLSCLTAVASFCFGLACPAGEWPRELKAYHGTTPKLDGVISAGEWNDATPITGVKDWNPQFTKTVETSDLSLKGWVKYDDHRLYFAFEVTDDVLYGIDTERWLPEKNPKAHELTRDGYPWFGDEMELLINAANSWSGDEDAAGDGSSWQMVCNLTKSRLGGIGVGGLLEGEPRSKASAWDNYQRWIKAGAMEAAVKVRPGGKGYVIEWAVSFDPCLEIKPGEFFEPTDHEVRMGLNIAVGDLDEKAKGEGNFGNFHHEDWWGGERNKRTHLRQWGTLVMMPGQMKRESDGR